MSSERSIPHLRDIFGLNGYAVHNHHSPTNHNGNGINNGGGVVVGANMDAYSTAMAVETKKSTTKKKRDNNKTLTSGDVKTLERHLSMKKTIRKKIMRDLQQAFVEDPNEFRVENSNSEQLKAEIRAEALRFGGEKHTRKSDNFLDMLRGEKPTSVNNDYSGNSAQNHDYDYDSPAAPVPCSGCGAVLHCADTGLPGYIPSEIFRGRTQKELQRIICQRCHFLKHYNIALDVAIAPEDYVKTLKSIQEKHALAVLIVDLLDFPCSIWPGIQEILGHKRPIFIVGNKVDLLPRDSAGYLSRIKDSLTRAIVNAGIHQMNIKHVALISAKTGYGIENLITQLHHTWKYEGDVYLVGCTNVGKSTLFNALLKSDYCKSQAFDLIQKATTCPWPGTTLQMLKFPILRPSDVRLYYRQKRLLSERAQQQAEEELQREQMRSTGKPKKAQTLIGHIGQTFVEDQDSLDPFSMSKGTSPILTLNEKDRAYVNSKWCYDTPGVVHPDQVLDLLTTEEIIQVLPKNVIQPQPFILKPGMSLHLAGLARLCFLEGNCNYIRIHVFASSELPILITTTDGADEVYSTLRGSEFLSVPLKDEIRQRKWPGLESSDPFTVVGEPERGATCDIVLSSIGWIGLELPSRASCTFRAWTPQKRGIHIRSPPLISQTSNLRGSKIRGSLAYRKKVSSF